MDPDDDLPPALGEAFRDAFHDMFANQNEAAQHAAPAASKELPDECQD